MLVPSAGGGNAMGAFALAAPLVMHRDGTLTALYVERPTQRSFLQRLVKPGADLAGRGLEVHLAQVADRLGDEQKRLTTRRVRAASAAEAVLAESARDYDLLMIGAAPQHLVAHSMIADVMSGARLPTVIVRSSGSPPSAFRTILVPIEGSSYSRLAAEFAFAYAAAVGAHITMLHVLNEARVFTGSLAMPDSREAHAVSAAQEAKLAERINADYGPLASTRTWSAISCSAASGP